MSPTKKEYGSEYLYSEDLLFKQAYHSVEVEIVGVHEPGTIKTKNNKLIDDKWTVDIVGKKGNRKKLVLCKTSTTVIHILTGDPPGPEWIGKTIRLEVRVVDSFGEMVPALRVMPPVGVTVQFKPSLIKRLGTKAVWNPPTEAK